MQPDLELSQSPIDETALERLFVEDPNFAALEQALEVFCPFEAMGVVRAEIRHNAFLASMLHPRRPHGYGSRLLKAFLIEAAKQAREVGSASEFSPLDFHLLDLTNAEVHAQWRHLDLVVVSDDAKLVVAIELKIDSRQGFEQLKRYRETVEQEWPQDAGWRRAFVFLTKAEEQPADEIWIPLRLKDLVPSLEQVAEADEEGRPGRAALRDYLAMLRRHHVMNEKLERVVRQLWTNHRAALEYLADRRPDELAEVFELLRARRKDLAVKGSQSAQTGERALSLVPDQDGGSTILRFAVNEWDQVPGFTKGERWTESHRILLLEIKREGNSVSAYAYLGPGPQEVRNRFVVVLDKHRQHKRTQRVGSDWMCFNKKRLYTMKDSGEVDHDKAVKEILDGFGSFCRQTLPVIDRQLQGLMPQEKSAEV